MSTFANVRAEAGLRIEDIATEFNLPLAVVQEWEAGGDMPPVHVIRTLEFLRRFAPLPNDAPTPSGIEVAEAATRYPQKNGQAISRSVDPSPRRRQKSRPMTVDFYAPEM